MYNNVVGRLIITVILTVEREILDSWGRLYICHYNFLHGCDPCNHHNFNAIGGIFRLYSKYCVLAFPFTFVGFYIYIDSISLGWQWNEVTYKKKDNGTKSSGKSNYGCFFPSLGVRKNLYETRGANQGRSGRTVAN